MPVKPGAPEFIMDDFSRTFAAVGASLGVDPFAAMVERERIVVSVDGTENAGKTHFAGTCPDEPRLNRLGRMSSGILYQCFDRKSLTTIEKFRNGVEARKKIAVMDYSYTFPHGADDMMKSNICTQKYMLFQQHYYQALETGRTVVWDHAGAVWECLRYGVFGKLSQIPPLLYGQVNTAFEEMIDRAYESDCNLVMLHRLGDEWEDVEKVNKKGETYLAGERTGAQKRKPAYKGIGYKVQAGVRVQFDPTTKQSAGYITDFQPDKTKEGTWITPFDFMSLALEVAPNVDPGAWL